MFIDKIGNRWDSEAEARAAWAYGAREQARRAACIGRVPVDLMPHAEVAHQAGIIDGLIAERARLRREAFALMQEILRTRKAAR